MAEKKVTKKEKYEMLLKIKEVKDNPILREHVENEIKLLENKKNSRGGANNKVTEEIKNLLLKVLGEQTEPVTISYLLENNEEIKNYTYTEGKEVKKLSNQKISAVFTMLIKDDKKVVNTKDKKKSFFALATEE